MVCSFPVSRPGESDGHAEVRSALEALTKSRSLNSVSVGRRLAALVGVVKGGLVLRKYGSMGRPTYFVEVAPADPGWVE